MYTAAAVKHRHPRHRSDHRQYEMTNVSCVAIIIIAAIILPIIIMGLFAGRYLPSEPFLSHSLSLTLTRSLSLFSDDLL